MAGRKRAVEKSEVYKVFEEYRFDIINGDKVLSEKLAESLWNQIRNDKRINKKMTTGALYTEALRWHKETSKTDGSPPAKTMEKKFKDISLELDLSENETTDSDRDTDSDENEPVDIYFTFTLSHEAWQAISPVSVQYERHDKSHKSESRAYYVLPEGLWTNVMIERIAEHRKKIICTWAFDRNKVLVNGENYLTITAHCTTCRANLKGFVANEPKPDEKVKFVFKVFNFNEQAHNDGRKNVRIGGKKAQDLFKSKEIASVLRRNEIVASGSKMFEEPKGRDVSENAIRCGQYRYRQSKKLSGSPIQALEYLKESNTYGPSIHWISTSPVSIIYGSTNQFVLFNAYRKANSYTKLCLDGTAGLVHKIGE